MNQEELEHYKAQAELQRSQLGTQAGQYAPQVFEQMQQSQAVLVEQTNPKKIVEEIILRLRGKKKNPDGSEVKVSEPKMNEEGIESISFMLDSHINQNTILSHLDMSEISHIMECLQEDLVDELALNWKIYGINKKTDLDAINNSVLINVFLALKRAEGQNEKNWISKISMEHISSAPNFPRAKKEGFWSKFRL